MVADNSQKSISVTLRVWRQAGPNELGQFKDYPAKDLSPHMSFLEMLDVVNDAPHHARRRADCVRSRLPRRHLRDLFPHHRWQTPRPGHGIATCQVYMRSFHDGDTIIVEPFRASAFPLIKDLIVDRVSFDKIMQAGGFVSIRTGAAPDANALPISKEDADLAMDAAACIGCGACVAACKNASAMLFVSAKVSQLGLLPQGQAERDRRVLAMVSTMDEQGFGTCTNQYECSAVCPKTISHDFIARMNRDYLGASLRHAFKPASANANAGGA